uniref:Uncharacterized protein n=1 Tax=Salix viminalis TaxID=40686 RepID=A0A6N2MVX7_SALVM
MESRSADPIFRQDQSDTCQEKGKWGLCITVRKRSVSFTETSNTAPGHHKLSNSLEKSICQGAKTTSR